MCERKILTRKARSTDRSVIDVCLLISIILFAKTRFVSIGIDVEVVIVTDEVRTEKKKSIIRFKRIGGFDEIDVS